jgi:hypothetical protein
MVALDGQVTRQMTARGWDNPTRQMPPRALVIARSHTAAAKIVAGRGAAAISLPSVRCERYRGALLKISPDKTAKNDRIDGILF